MRSYLKASLLVLTGISVLVFSGCAAAPPPEAVMSGTWKLTTDQPSALPTTYLTFDSNGNLTQIQFVTSKGTITQSNLNSTTLVNGSTVTISATFGVSTVSFNGTLNSVDPFATGFLSTALNLSNGIVVNLTGVAATLSKVEN
jgi:hypothetical protein